MLEKQLNISRNLSIFGEPKSIKNNNKDIFTWPITGKEDEDAVLRILRDKPLFQNESEILKFENEFADWCGTKYALAHPNGASAILTAMFACGIKRGDEVIAPSCTYWGSVIQCFNLGATVVFADVHPTTLCIDPIDIEKKISQKTKAIIVVHFLGYPCDMDAINMIAKKYNIKVIEDASHAHGSLYRNKKVGSIGDIGAFSLGRKSMTLGEGGIFVTNDRDLFEKGIAWSDNFRFNASNVHNQELVKFAGLPMGGATTRMHGVTAALGRVQLQHYDERIKEVDSAMNYFWDLIEDLPGIEAHRPPKNSGCSMGGWYCPHGIYHTEELGGLSVSRFVEALRAEGYYAWTRSCIKEPLHLHPMLNECDIYGHGKPTRIANTDRDLRQSKGSLPITENIKSFTVPAFKKYIPEIIEEYAACFRKVIEHHEELIPGDLGDEAVAVDERGNG
jgi:dTDP-4-amino-4,6-dideoxygalactose transaminase